MDEIRVKVFSWGPNRPLTMQWVDPISGQRKTATTGTYDEREAERIAGEKEKQLRAGVVVPSKITWKAFRQRYREDKLDAMGKTTRVAYEVSLNHVDRVLNPSHLHKMTTATITTFVARLRKQGMIDTTLARHLRGVRAALRWAHRHGYLAVVPNIDMPKGVDKMKGRAATGEEFDRMLADVVKVRPNDPAPWTRLLHGLWLSGLRISEAVAASWDEGSFQIDLHGRHPAWCIQGDGQKSKKAEVCPMTPDFATWLLDATPEALRTGKVFPLPDHRKGREGRYTGTREAMAVVSDIGEAAGVVVDVETGRTASAHDLRRSFGTRWARKVMPAILQKLMRHADIQTTMKFYVNLDADEMAAELWRDHAPQESFNKSINKGRKRKPAR